MISSNKIFWILIAFVAGTFLPIQAGLNAKLSKAGSSSLHASMISFIVGAIALILYVVITRQSVSWEGIKTAPLHAWIGGLFGATFVTIVILSYPQLGPALTFGLVVAGQMFISAILEHFNILVSQAQHINLPKIIGLLLIITGVIIIRKF